MSIQKSTLLIVNPYAKSGKALGIAHKIENAISKQSHGIEGMFMRVDTSGPGDAATIAQKFGPAYDRIMVLGGDGVVHEVVNGIMELQEKQRPLLIILPCGNGNDFARSLGLPLDPMKVFNSLDDLREITCDLGCSNGEWFAETLSFGLDAAIADETHQLRAETGRSGTKLYVQCGLNQIANNLKPIHAKVSFDGGDSEDIDFITFAVNNGVTYGGGFRITPDADLCDEKLDICYASGKFNKMSASALFAKALRGTHVKSKKIFTRTAREVLIEFDDDNVIGQIDGELLIGTRFDVFVEPKALRVLAAKEK